MRPRRTSKQSQEFTSPLHPQSRTAPAAQGARESWAQADLRHEPLAIRTRTMPRDPYVEWLRRREAESASSYAGLPVRRFGRGRTKRAWETIPVTLTGDWR